MVDVPAIAPSICPVVAPVVPIVADTSRLVQVPPAVASVKVIAALTQTFGTGVVVIATGVGRTVTTAVAWQPVAVNL